MISATPTHTVTSISAFAMGKYEVTYAEWQAVYNWATFHGYTFANAGVMGIGPGAPDHPVTTINWRDTIVWCNAASEKDGFSSVYFSDAGFVTPLKTSTNTTSVDFAAGSEDNPFVNWSANGYRLPTQAEWEYAARYFNGVTFMRGDAPSGWIDNSPTNGSVDLAEIDAVAWWSNNSSATSHASGTKNPNFLSLFDMSGNAWEWLWDWWGSYTSGSPFIDADSQGPSSGTYRIVGGGYAGSVIASMQVSNHDVNAGSVPWVASSIAGLRVVRRP